MDYTVLSTCMKNLECGIEVWVVAGSSMIFLNGVEDGACDGNIFNCILCAFKFY